MTSFKIKILVWEKEALQKILDELEIKFLATSSIPNMKSKLIEKYRNKVKILDNKIAVEKLRELKE
jgi:hypothetical protein